MLGPGPLPKLLAMSAASRRPVSLRDAAALALPLLAALGCSPGPPARAQMTPLTTPMNLPSMVDDSENVVRARVTAVRVEPHPQFQNLNTVVVTLEVIEALKGSPGKQLVFRQYNPDATETQSTLGYRVGEEIVLLLRKPSAEGLTSPVGFDQGRFLVQRDAAGNLTVRNSMDNAGLFDGVDAASPGLKARLSPALRNLVDTHLGGPIPYDQFKSIVSAEIAARQGAR
jgi:hypothetical protein